MTRVYRVLRKNYSSAPFDGEGAYRFGGHWSSPGIRLAYTSEHESLALLEYFVHLDKDDPPDDLVLATADIPDNLSRERVRINRLPANRRDFVASSELARFGDELVDRAERSILIVPSALASSENNWLINPAHADSRRIVPRAVGRSTTIRGCSRSRFHVGDAAAPGRLPERGRSGIWQAQSPLVGPLAGTRPSSSISSARIALAWRKLLLRWAARGGRS